MTSTVRLSAGTGPDTWSGLHCFLHWPSEHVDSFLTEVVAPLMNGLRDTGRIADWFFIRYSEDGPHLRIRARGADPATLEHWRGQLVASVRAATYPVLELADPTTSAWRPHGEVRQVDYEPETERYGGPGALTVAEEVFGHSSRIATSIIARTARQGQRLVAGTDLILATAIALDLDMLGTAQWLRRGAVAWRWHRDAVMLAPPTVQEPALNAATAQAGAVIRRWREISASTSSGTRLRDHWAGHVRVAHAKLTAEGTTSQARLLNIWSSQLHMLLNRLGILPDEERSLYFFIAASLLAPDGPADFFADSTEHVDRRYLAASQYQRARIEAQQPRRMPPAVAPLRRNPVGSPVPLPSGEPVRTPLSDALTNRVSAHGDLGGTVTARELGTLLWSAVARPTLVSNQPSRRPYPSAGAKYAARLRLIVRDVAGLPTNQYEVDAVSRTLLPLGPVPDDDELVAACMWFAPEPSAQWNGPPQHEPIIMSTLPALLGLYVDLSAIRASYGLRALRFALLEAGHLAQNLALTAAATGLSMGVCGGFYDDIAHELFLLDGVDEVLTYLLPVGRQRN